MALLFIPRDAEFIKAYSPDGRPETTVTVYHSSWLAELFPNSDWVWFGEPAGTFIVLQNIYDGMSQRFIVATGNNP
jgi:hypothetical protein